MEGNAALLVGADSIDLPSYLTKNSLGTLLAEAKKLAFEQYSNNKTSGFKLLESNMTTLDGNPASKLVYLAKSDAEPEKEMKYTELVTVKDNMKYTVIFSVYPDAYNRYLPTTQEMIDSIKFTTMY